MGQQRCAHRCRIGVPCFVDLEVGDPESHWSDFRAVEMRPGLGVLYGRMGAIWGEISEGALGLLGAQGGLGGVLGWRDPWLQKLGLLAGC